MLSRASTAPAVRHLPTKSSDAQLLGCQVDAFLCEHVVDDRQIFLLIRRMVLDDKTKAIRERNRFVDAVVAIYLILLALTPCFTNEVTAIGRRIDAYIGRAGRYTSLDGSFVRLEFGVRVLDGQLV